MVTEKWVLFLEDVSKEDIGLVGGKCANLGEMMKLGVPVPPGFAVTTKAYDAFLDQTGASEEMTRYLEKFPEGPKVLSEFETVSETIQGMILSREIPKPIQDVIAREYETLCDRTGILEMAVAVRSSGVAEDLPSASFAGQYDSYLNIKGAEAVLEKVRLCWSSAFNAHCINYRVQNGLGVLAGSISTAVQKMVNSRAAGVAFTVSPITGDDTRIILEGNWGLGESVVQGVVKPDVYAVQKESLVLEDKEIRTKLRQFSFTERGTEEGDVPAEKQAIPCLSDEEAVKVAEYTKKVETHYGVPIDVEWAIDNDLPFPERVFLVQARPVTVIVEKKSTTDLIIDNIMTRFRR